MRLLDYFVGIIALSESSLIFIEYLLGSNTVLGAVSVLAYLILPTN